MDVAAKFSALFAHMLHQSRQVVALVSKMMDGADGASGRLFVEVQPAAADAHEYVSGTAKITVIGHFATKHCAVPGDAGIQVCGKEVSVMYSGHRLISRFFVDSIIKSYG
jgi:hypothetical protein